DYGKSWIEQPGVKETKGRDKWSFPSPPHQAHVKMMTIDPRDPNVIYAGVEQGDLLKTTDGGAHWRVLDDYSKPTDWTYRDIHLVVVHPANSAELYMTTGMGLYRSLDAGETWTLIIDNNFRIGYPDHLIVSPRDGNSMFMAGAGENPGTWRASHSAAGTIMRSRDRGVSWTDASQGLPAERRANIEAMSLAAYPDGFALFAGDTDGAIYASDDEAQSWRQIAGLAPVSKGNHYRALQPA
ncbi:MAG: WD40/YVTN/BNR-like repeat-containing protein, partial [Stellaceae bacterium]